MKYLLALTVLFSLHSYSQCKTYRIGPKGDTLNCVDQNDKKQGRWVVSVEGIRGEPGYDEEGAYKDDKKEGTWRVYTSMGDLFAIENYRWGNKDGISRYFNIAGLVREESWKAVNPENPFDTVDVPDPVDPYKVERKLVKIEGTAVKHGTWKFYESGSGSLLKTETYFLGKIEDPMKSFATKSQPNAAPSADNAVANAKSSGDNSTKPPAKAKPKEVMDFEKKAGKKKVKVVDGTTY